MVAIDSYAGGDGRLSPLSTPSATRAVLEAHGIGTKYTLGQNFLVNDDVLKKIVALAEVGENDRILEVGPGIGPLTQELSRRAGRVVSVELDRSLLPILSETMAGRENVEIVPGDILKTDLAALTAEKFPGLTPLACANLPYNITSPAITALIQAGVFAAITVMIQREVALRICARPGTPDYGAFSVFCQYHTAPELLFEVPPSCFIPAPKVTSAVLRMTPRPAPAEVDDEAHFFRVVRAAFAQRRKTLANSLTSSLSGLYTKEDIQEAIRICGLAPDVRGERLGIPEFAALSKALRAQPQ